jgi:hypothetical protein
MSMPVKITLLAVVLLFDTLLIGLAWINIAALRDCAEAPVEYRRLTRPLAIDPLMPEAPAVEALDGRGTETIYLLRYRLCSYRAGDSVRVTIAGEHGRAERTIALARRFSNGSIVTFIIVGMAFFLFGIAVVLWRRHERYAVVLHCLSALTALMVLYDWGATTAVPAALLFITRFLFDCAIWLVPTLFFHFSFIWPSVKHASLRAVLLPWYLVSFAGIALSAWQLTGILLHGVSIEHTWYLALHYPVNDGFVVIGLLATVASFEHSALTIPNALVRRRIYWVLLGIIFGPLVDVFLIMVPRMMLGYELVSHSMMQWALLMGPATLWMAIRKRKGKG